MTQTIDLTQVVLVSQVYLCPYAILQLRYHQKYNQLGSVTQTFSIQVRADKPVVSCFEADPVSLLFSRLLIKPTL